MAARAASPWVLGARSETGFVRAVNEDRMGWTRTPFGDVYVISDGMGGYRGGALAAEVTLATLQQQLASVDPESPRFSADVQQAFAVANEAVREHRDPEDPATKDMGATGVALITTGKRFAVAHVGDSRAYLWRGGQLRQLTRDHSRVQVMMDSGLLTPEQALVHPDASVLDRAIGHKPTVQADVGEWLAIEPRDVLLLCSDGLCGYVPDHEIAAILEAGGTPQETTDRLVQCALGKGGEDNVTVQLVGYAPSGGSMLRRPFGRTPVIAATAAVTALIAGPFGYFASQHRSETRISGSASTGTDVGAPAVVAAPTARASSAVSTWPPSLLSKTEAHPAASASGVLPALPPESAAARSQLPIEPATKSAPAAPSGPKAPTVTKPMIPTMPVAKPKAKDHLPVKGARAVHGAQPRASQPSSVPAEWALRIDGALAGSAPDTGVVTSPALDQKPGASAANGAPSKELEPATPPASVP